jgi:DNA repair protein RadD
MYKLRKYQEDASRAAVEAFKDKRRKNGLLILPTGAGKSLVIADIASKLDGPLLVFQPSKEILEQNFAKLQSYGIWDCSLYSASVGSKDINRITFATIGSVMNHMDDFKHFKNIMVDECHFVNSKGGMYEEFIHAEPNRKVIGLTATPYRLCSNSWGSMLKFLTRTRPRIFKDVIYYCQIHELLAQGFLAELNYYDITNMDMTRVMSNSTGADYDDKSLLQEYERSNFYENLLSTIERLRNPKRGGKRKGILVFTRYTKEAQMVCDNIPNCAIVTGETPKRERENLLNRFKAGEIEVIANVGVLTTGFDYPELDTIVLARPTKSLALYYQMVGRAIRPSKDKIGWVVDMCGNYSRFGSVADLRIECPVNSTKWMVTSKGRQLTNVFF